MLERPIIETRAIHGGVEPDRSMLRDSKNPVPTGRYGCDGDAVW
jgi:hypothetical protein